MRLRFSANLHRQFALPKPVSERPTCQGLSLLYDAVKHTGPKDRFAFRDRTR
jgi:hypothetical protein